MVVTNGGGPGVMAADRFADHGVELAELSPATLEALDGVLPSVWSRANPVDIIGDATPERYQQALQAVLDDPHIDGALVMLTPQAMTMPTEVAQAVIETASGSDKMVMTTWMGGTQVARARVLFDRLSL